MRWGIMGVILVAMGVARAAEEPRPDILLLTFDTLRTDRLQAYGGTRPVMPHLDNFALSARVFTDVVADMPQTGPSMCSMFSSLPPRLTGCVRNGVPLPESVRTMTQTFQEAGYETAAIVSNWNLKRKLSGLERGFEMYDDDFGRNWLGREQQELYADEVTARAMKWLDERAGRDGDRKPLFFWVHYMDPHAPYRYHSEFNVWGQTPRDLGTREEVPLRYDSECGFADHHAGILLERARAAGMTVVFTADHGESLHEHNYLGHTRQIYHVIMHIPLMVWRDGIEAGKSDTPGRGIDIAPTVLGLAGLPAWEGARGRDLLGAHPAPAGPRVFETYGGSVNEGERDMAVIVDREPAYQGVLHQGWKLITDADKNHELYRVPDDPYEEHNVAGAEIARVQEYLGHIRQWMEETPRATADPALLSGEDIEALEAAGYL
jgi:arylsulfatase A-like enzyme